MYKHTQDYDWSFGQCTSSHEWIEPGIYSEKCCVSENKNILTCSTANKDDDWSNNVLMLLGHRFCDDLVDYSASFLIDVSGILIYSYMYSHINCASYLALPISYFYLLIILYFQN